MASVVVDSGVLLLLVVGLANPDDISETRRLKHDFDSDDFERLTDLLAPFETIVVTPHALTEVDNLLGNGSDERSRRSRKALETLVRSAVEVYRPSADLVDAAEFTWLGLADVAQLLAVDEGVYLLTADGPLHAAAAGRGIEAMFFLPERTTV